ncbi:DUF6194 family protein [Actinomadura violacea]|uniref:DUF6194 domain-containing protein n=1 Tax=Actinomadura violacea TaxID=2819934 RepID=A0ABS3RRJ4_9ACTN|nr:DUF6194 family protein [Actinomadura violacea]MBO2458694.1 hypothetical protein [Actinomadura violacea]
MSIEEITELAGGLEGVLVLRPQSGDGSPEIAWGDVFFYYAPDGAVPEATQPFATIVTKDYPGDEASRLDRPGAFRLNIAAGKDAFARWAEEGDPSAADVLRAHPVYGDAGWLAVVNPGPRTEEAVRELLGTAHAAARRRRERRSALRRP